MTTSQKFSALIKKIRKEKNLTQKQLSELSGINLSAITSIEYNNRIPDVDTVDKLINALGCEILVRRKK